MAHRVSLRAEADPDEIWLYIARESGSMEVANRQIDSLTDRFSLLARFPHAGRSREREFGVGMRSFPAGEYVIVYCVDGSDVSILRVVHGKRDFEANFEQ
jgi:toxin ParE1/3/4